MSLSQIQTNIYFNNNWLNSITGLSITAVDPYNFQRSLSNQYISRTDKTKTANGFYTQRIVSVTVVIAQNSRALMEQALDTLLGYLQGIEKELAINQAGGGRKYFCTFDGSDVKDYKGGYMKVELKFRCSDIFGYAIGPTTALTLSSQTGNNRSDAITFAGSAPWQVPVFTYTISALTGGTTKDVSIGNNITGQAITITRTWTAGDIIEIDCFNRSVKVNGADVAFSGAFPDFAPGSGNVTYVDTLTTRTIDATVIYSKRYV